jgi:hypothetical protein
MSAQSVKPAISENNIAKSAAASAGGSARVDFARRVTSRWPSPIFSLPEVIAQTQPDSRLWGNLVTASGAKLMTVYGEFSRPPLGRTS